jgi:molybdopterin-dependent oxidoreductase alpha subunit
MTAPSAAGGLHALLYTFKKARKVGFSKLWRAMSTRNACKTCALGMGGQKGGMVNELGHWPEVCKKSLQAMTSDMQGAISKDFFERFSIKELQQLTPKELEHCGRIAFPVIQEENATHYKPLSWPEALDKIAAKFRNVSPEKSVFYFSGRSSNEAGFLLQLFARSLGSNHVNNCSYYCHQASGEGINRALGSGTATLNLDDIDKCDLVFLIGGNPASNHPRLMTSLMRLRRRGGQVIVINPMKELGSSKFRIPSNIKSFLFGDRIESIHLRLKIGSDIALLTGIAKHIVQLNTHNLKYIEQHCDHWDEFHEMISTTSWDEIIGRTGLSKDSIIRVAEIYARSKKTIFAWTMGITHHLHGVDNVNAIINLALLRGMIGQEGTGLLPIRGHSNVQGMGTMGVTPAIKAQVFERMQNLGFTPPTHKGYDTMASMEASKAGKVDLMLCLGGNLYGSNPDATYAREAMSKIDSVIYMSTTLNTGHVLGLGRSTIILPVAARDEEAQKTTQESMFNLVRISDGGQARVSEAWSESRVISAIAERVQPKHEIFNWQALSSHDNIRQLIAKIVPNFEQMARNVQSDQEFVIPKRIFHTPSFNTSNSRAQFIRTELPKHKHHDDHQLTMMSIRSEGQFNTVVYETEDVYRGQKRRNVILMNSEDIKKLSLAVNQNVTVQGPVGSMSNIIVRPFEIATGCAAMYYPECNSIIGRAVDPISKTPAYKAVPISIISG